MFKVGDEVEWISEYNLSIMGLKKGDIVKITGYREEGKGYYIGFNQSVRYVCGFEHVGFIEEEN